MKKRKGPGPEVGTVYKDAAEIKHLLIGATIDLLKSGVSVADITARSITSQANLDKMYVSRFFGNKDNLFLATVIELVGTRMSSLIGADVFDAAGSGQIDPQVALAFDLFTYLAKKPDLEPQLRGLAETVLGLYRLQIEKEFGLTGTLAERQAVLGLMALVGYLSVGHLIPVDNREIATWVEGRRELLKLYAERQERTF